VVDDAGGAEDAEDANEFTAGGTLCS